MADEPQATQEKQEMIMAAKSLPPMDTFSLRPRTFEEAYRFANLIAESDLIPKEFHKKPANVLLAVQLGMEIGVSPMQALQNIAVINGRPTIWGDLLPAIVYNSGLLESINETDDGETATCTVKRKGFDPITRTFSMEDAKRAGLIDKPGPWKQYPRRMRQMRARGFAFRDGFADVLKGVAVREEIEDTPIEVQATPVQEERQAIEAPRRLSEKQKPASEAAPAQTEPQAATSEAFELQPEQNG